MNLDLKYRPESFTGIYGNPKTINSLVTLAEKDQLPHTILLSGPTGCGKTTIARIISKVLNCSDADYTEINISDDNGIDTIRNLISDSHYLPLNGKSRIFVLDEVQNLTAKAQDASLKLLEEPPKHCYYILCTTDPQNLKPTLLNRCSKYNVQTLDEKDMMSLLRSIVRNENIEISKEQLNLIIKHSSGIPRTAIKMLERAGEIDEESISKFNFSQTQTIDLIKLLLNSSTKWEQITPVLKELKDENMESIRRTILNYCSAVLLNQSYNSFSSRVAMIMDYFSESVYNSGFAGIVFNCFTIINSK